MVSADDIKIAYQDPSILGDFNGRNYAMDVSSRIRVIRLVDGRVKYQNNELYVPGESYLLSFREMEKSLKCRKNFELQGINIFPLIIDYILNGKEGDDIFDSNNFPYIHSLDGPSQIRLKGLENGIVKEALNLKKFIRKERREDYLVLLKSLSPIELVENYELDEVCYSSRHRFTEPLPSKLEVLASEAEFSFVSDSYAKIKDSDRGIGGYKEGILTLQEPTFFIDELDDKIENKKRFALNFRDKNEEEFDWEQFFLSDWRRGLITGTVFGSVLGGVTAGLVTLIPSLISKVFDLSSEWVGPFIYGGVSCTTLYGAVIGCGSAVNNSRWRLNPFFIRGYDVKGESLMKSSFCGFVKDRRFDNFGEIEKRLYNDSGKIEKRLDS